MRGLEMWRSGIRSQAEEVDVPGVSILCFQALFDWHAGEILSCDATMAEAISVARKFNDMHGLAVALWHAGWLAYFERNTTEVERCASEFAGTVNPSQLCALAGCSRGIERLGPQRFE